MSEVWAPCNLTLGERYEPYGSGKYFYGDWSREFTCAIHILIRSGRWDAEHEIRLLSDCGGEYGLDSTFEPSGRQLKGIGQDEWSSLKEIALLPKPVTEPGQPSGDGGPD